MEILKNAQGEVAGFSHVIIDLTDKQRANAQLEESERRFRLFVDSVADHAIYMLDPCGLITNWNAGAKRIKGYTAEEIIGSHFGTFYTREDRARRLPRTTSERKKGICGVAEAVPIDGYRRPHSGGSVIPHERGRPSEAR